MKTELSKVNCKYGAPLGRSNVIPADIETAGKLYLEKLEWVDSAYTYDGTYWGGGLGDNIYCASGETATGRIDIFVRAKSRDEAKELVSNLVPTVKFYR